MKDPNYSLLPEHLRTGMRLWIEQGIRPGGFLRSVVTNDLIQASLRADGISKQHLSEIARWLVHNAPEGSFGRSQVLDNWPLYIGARSRQEEAGASAPDVF